MSESETTPRNITSETSEEKLYFPSLAPLYANLAQPLAWTALRVAIGLALAYSGWSKIMAPMAMSGFVESLGFYPGWLWSPLMAVANFAGGLLIAIGLFTRPAALANGLMLLVTLYYHITHPYPPVFLTEAGIAALSGTPELFTGGGLGMLKDGGASFLGMMQEKAVTNSLFWAGGTFLYAAFGGGRLSVDRVMKKVF
ncbi:DoxX family protein [Cohaesibacter haloalkalitolerans]|uniref:DoxX family protein n=1 Tax=Cohaesibacter haloalkalitolerans TaxID=1162980 RepID=UPI000E654F95|nr:DoxX family protein [Cohaesibacter haloalkalitolerans]